MMIDVTALHASCPVAAVERAGLQYDVPTYVLSECVLVYMEPSDSAAVVRWLGERFTTAALVVYEQVWGMCGWVCPWCSGRPEVMYYNSAWLSGYVIRDQ